MQRLLHAAVLIGSCGLGSCTISNLAKPLGPLDSDLQTTTIDRVSFDAVYVVNGEAATVSVINADQNVVAGTVRLIGAAYPHHISISADRSLLGLAVPGYDMSQGQSGHEQHSSRAGLVLIIDALTGALVSTRRIDAANHNVVFGPDDRVWTSQATRPGSTLVLKKDSLDISDAISVGTSPAETVLTSDGTLAYVANAGSSNVSVIDVAKRALKATISVGAGPIIAQPGANGMVFVENESDETISVIDSATFAVVKTFNLGFRPGTIATSPNGQLWIPAPARGGVEVRDEKGTVLHFIATGPGAHGLAFSADGTRAYASNELDASVSVIDLAKLAVTTKIPVGSQPNGLVWRSR